MRLLVRTNLFAFALVTLFPLSAWARSNLELVRVEAPEAAVGGQSVTVTLSVDFSGEVLSGDVPYEILLVPGFDLEAGTTVASGTSRGPASRRDIEVSVPVPADRVGQWRVAARLDPDDQVQETNEFDNEAFARDLLRVAAPRVDFLVAAVSASKSVVREGETLAITARLQNLGSESGTATVHGVLSRGRVPTGDDAEIEATVVQLEPGAETTVSLSHFVPTLDAGSYRAGVWLEVDQTDSDPANDRAVADEVVTVVQDQLQILTGTIGDGVVALSYFVSLDARGGDGSYVYTVSSGALPPGLELDGNVIMGLPSTSGIYPFALQVESRGLTAESTYEVEIFGTNQDLVVVTSTLPGARLGFAYDQALLAGGGEGPYTWGLAEGALPDGLQVSGDRLSGTPTEVGRYEFTLRVEDRLGSATERSFSIRVETSESVLVESALLPVASAGVAYETNLAATGGIPPYRWVALSELPVGVRLDPDGRVSGTPGRPGAFVFRVEVTDDSQRGIADRSIVYLLVEDPANFEIVAPDIDTLLFGNAFEEVFEVVGGVRPYRWSVAPGSRLPDNTFFANGEGADSDRGILFGAPRELGAFGFGVLVEDGQGRRRELGVAVTVDRVGGTTDGGCECLGVGSSTRPFAGFAALGLVLLVGHRRRRR